MPSRILSIASIEPRVYIGIYAIFMIIGIALAILAPMKVSGAVAPLFLAKPTKEKEWFMTHPPLNKRIARLERM